MNYEMQWVLHEHSANVIFPERERNIQKTLMQEYEKVKSQIWGKLLYQTYNHTTLIIIVLCQIKIMYLMAYTASWKMHSQFLGRPF